MRALFLPSRHLNSNLVTEQLSINGLLFNLNRDALGMSKGSC
jgi:hypothetical protein